MGLQLVHVSWYWRKEHHASSNYHNSPKQPYKRTFWHPCLLLSFHVYITRASSMTLTNCFWLTCLTAPPPQWETSRRNESSTHAWLIHPTDDSLCWSFYLSFWLNECFVCLKINTVDVPCQHILLETMAYPKVLAWIIPRIILTSNN